MNKLFKMILSIILILSVVIPLTACQNDNSTSKSEPTQSEAAATDAPQGEPETADSSTDTHYEISIGLWDSGTWGDDEVSDLLNTKFNITIMPVSYSWGDYIEKYNIQAASDSLPDMFAHPGWDDTKTKSSFLRWIEQEIIQPLPDNYQDKYENIEKVMSNYDFFKVNDKDYFVPRYAWEPPNDFNSAVLLVRKDWMENVGITEYPKNLDELFELMEAFTFNDPDQNGLDDTYGMSRNQNVGEGWIFNIFGTDPEIWIKEDGEYIPGMVSKNNIPAIEYVQKLYNAKVLDPDYAILKFEEGMDKFIQGKTGIICWTAEAYNLKNYLVDKMQKANPDWGVKVVDVMPPIEEAGYTYTMLNKYNHWSGTLFNANLDADKLDRCLQLYDYLLSDEGLELGRFGIEGKHFTKEDGKYESLLPIDENTGLPTSIGIEVPTANIKTLVTWDVDGRWLEPAIPQNAVDLEKKACELYRDKQSDIDPRIQYMSTPAKDAMDISDLFWKTVYTSEMKSDDIEADFNEFVKNVLENKGVKEAIDEVNQKAKEMGIN